MADFPQLPVDSQDHRQLVTVVNTSVRRLNRPVLPSYTVAELSALAALADASQVQPGEQGFATNGRKAGEGAGSGTGVVVFYDGTNWIACDTGATVAA